MKKTRVWKADGNAALTARRVSRFLNLIMTFADINGGRPYVEDFTYTDEVRISTLDCSSFTNPYQMKEYAEMRLADYAKPIISYVLNAMDLSVLTGYELSLIHI